MLRPRRSCALTIKRSKMLDLIIGAIITSHHSTLQQGMTNDTPGLYIQAKADYCKPTAGVYSNSLGHMSAFMACSFGNDYFSVAVGGVSGYSAPVIPFVSPSLAIPIGDHFAARVHYLPAFKDINKSAVLVFSIERGF